MRHFYDFLTALGFLTRLAPGRLAGKGDVSRSAPYMPAVGAVLGLLCTWPLWTGLLRGHELVQAFTMVITNLYLTRGLHLDGLADVADACGQHLDKDRFWTIIKDSRSGVFGCAAVCLYCLGLVLLLAPMAGAGEVGAVAFVFVMSRTAALVLCRLSASLARPGLGALFIGGAGTTAAMVWVAFALVLGLVSTDAWVMACGVILCGAVVAKLYFLGRKVGGVNGDFLGCAICLSEICLPLSWLLVHG